MGARTTTAPTPTGAEQNQARNGLEGAAHRFAPLWPLILGLAFGRAGLIVASYGSYTSTDEGIFTDGAMLVALVVLALFLVFIVLSKRTISKHVTNVIMRTCVALEAFVLMALAVFDLFGIGDEIERFALSSLCTLVSSGAIYYWLRRARGTSTTTAAVFVFAALDAVSLLLHRLFQLVCIDRCLTVTIMVTRQCFILQHHMFNNALCKLLIGSLIHFYIEMTNRPIEYAKLSARIVYNIRLKGCKIADLHCGFPMALRQQKLDPEHFGNILKTCLYQRKIQQILQAVFFDMLF